MCICVQGMEYTIVDVYVRVWLCFGTCVHGCVYDAHLKGIVSCVCVLVIRFVFTDRCIYVCSYICS